MRDPRTQDRHDEEPSPLDVVPGLADLSRIVADAVTVTDVHRRVVVWNPASEALYGITEADALGNTVEELFDSTIVGAGISSAGARTLALDLGSWRGRVADRPRVGRFVGQELVIEAVLSRIPGPDDQPVGVLSVKRDVTASVRVERELSALGSLATATGEARSRATLAERALEVLIETVGATHGAIVLPTERGGRILAGIGVPDAIRNQVQSLEWAEGPAVRAVSTVGRVVKGQVERIPLAPDVRRDLLQAGVHALLIVGLHREDELVGILSLGWDTPDPVLPSDAVILLVANHIARGLENARLVEEIVRRAEAERATGARLRALDELTRVGGNVMTLQELADRSGRLINQALGAAGTTYGLLEPSGDEYSVSSIVGIRPPVADWLRSHRPDLRSAFRRWRAGEGAYLEAFEPGVVGNEYLTLAREAGVTASAAIPIRVDDTVVGGIVASFDRPVSDLHLDRTALDRVATIASISLANFRLRERLVGSEQRYRTLFEESPDALLVALPVGTVVDANEAALRVFRAERAWLLGRRPTELDLFDTDAARERAASLEVGASFVSRGTGSRSTGERFPHEVEVAGVELEGEPRLLIRVRDLTEQERLQGELIQAQKMEATGQLVSGVAHELNNPLAAILGFSQLIRRDPSLPDGLRNNADLLVEEASRTRRIVQNLLDFARQRPPERHPTAIRALVDSVLALQSYSLGTGLIEVDVDIPPDLPHVELDRGQLQQVLVNLTHNAIYAIKTGGGGRIRISAAPEGPPDDERVRVTVMDDGPGVAPEDVGRLFEAFFTTKPPADGTGLGLPVSYGIVSSHGGELRYVPSAWGRGAAFTFDLPVHAAVVGPVSTRPDSPFPDDDAGRGPEPGPIAVAETSTEAGPAAASAAAAIEATPTRPPIETEPAAPLRVLVLDDEPSIRVFLEKAIQTLGFQAVVAATGTEAIEQAGHGDYAALLCDHQMAGMSGTEVIDAIARRYPRLAERAVLMSGDVLNPELETFAANRGIGLLAKPFDMETLERTIRGLAAGAVRASRSA